MSCRCSVCWNNPLWLKIEMYALKLSRDSLYLWVHPETVLKTLGLITVLTVLYLTSARLSVWASNLCEPMFLSRASKEYMALQYMAGPTEKGLAVACYVLWTSLTETTVTCQHWLSMCFMAGRQKGSRCGGFSQHMDFQISLLIMGEKPFETIPYENVKLNTCSSFFVKLSSWVWCL